LTNLSDLTPEIINNEKVITHITKALEYVLIVITNIIDPKTIIVGGPSLEPFYDIIRNKIEETIRYKTWIGGPENIKWYYNDDMFGAYGTILNASEKMINSYIEDHLI
jgi:predicted NBD/HSP70 family sugar kinase